ncbi:hypothetical protein CDAR_308491 [Caerostris darwini]|uniref:Uncharacterized protein n=1 Tax=Caerostris darwini TaxID=1538125 RepID=A0AAV4S3V9_9ARAC|nr:hypothetical protein CDAR_308491 [Caerostris darwini]
MKFPGDNPRFRAKSIVYGSYGIYPITDITVHDIRCGIFGIRPVSNYSIWRRCKCLRLGILNDIRIIYLFICYLQEGGIRRHVALKLAEFGAEVVAVSRAQSDLDALHKEVRRKVFAQISPVSKSEKGFESEVLRLFLSQLRSKRKEIVGGVENKRLKKEIRRDLMFYPLDVFV